ARRCQVSPKSTFSDSVTRSIPYGVPLDVAIRWRGVRQGGGRLGATCGPACAGWSGCTGVAGPGPDFTGPWDAPLAWGGSARCSVDLMASCGDRPLTPAGSGLRRISIIFGPEPAPHRPRVLSRMDRGSIDHLVRKIDLIVRSRWQEPRRRCEMML